MHGKQTKIGGVIRHQTFALKDHLRGKAIGQRFMIPWSIHMADGVLWKSYTRAIKLSLIHKKQINIGGAINNQTLWLKNHLKLKAVGQRSMIPYLIDVNDKVSQKRYKRAIKRSPIHKNWIKVGGAINNQSFSLKDHLKLNTIRQRSWIS